MPSERKVIAYRPDETEEEMIARIIKKRGIPASRVLGQLVREEFERQGFDRESKAETDRQ